ncbi:hypothetical protein HY522_03765 [bacterium]|nr:hypothetical protein [bacterium]
MAVAPEMMIAKPHGNPATLQGNTPTKFVAVMTSAPADADSMAYVVTDVNGTVLTGAQNPMGAAAQRGNSVEAAFDAPNKNINYIVIASGKSSGVKYETSTNVEVRV